MPFYTNEDGRAFTEYRSSCEIDNQIKKQNGLTNNYEYKLFLQRNGDSMLQSERAKAVKTTLKCDCKSCKALTYNKS